jgi:hypothetical protein
MRGTDEADRGEHRNNAVLMMAFSGDGLGSDMMTASSPQAI